MKSKFLFFNSLALSLPHCGLCSYQMAKTPRNRAGRRGNDPRGTNSNQHRQSTSASAGSRDSTANTNHNRRGGKSGSNLSKSTDNIQNGPAATLTSLPPQDDHVSLAGFNAAGIEAALKQGFDPKAPLYRPDTKSQPTTPQSPWGVKREFKTHILELNH